MKKKNVMIFLIVALLVSIASKVGKDRILPPPEITNEILQSEESVSAVLHVEGSSNIANGFACKFDLNEDGSLTLVDDEAWQAYINREPSETYEFLTTLSSKNLMEIHYTQTGLLAIYYADEILPITLIELDEENQIVFEYEFEGKDLDINNCDEAFVDEENLYIIYMEDNETVYLLTVNKASGAETTQSFTWEEIVGEEGDAYYSDDFMIGTRNVWMKDSVLYFTQTHDSYGGNAEIGAYDFSTKKAVGFKVFEDAQIMAVVKGEDSFEVLVNHKNFTPLALYEFDTNTLAEKSKLSLELPDEYLSELEGAGDFLFELDIEGERIAVLFPDNQSLYQLDDNENFRKILAVYDKETGEMKYRSRLTIDADYEINEISLK